MRTNKSKLSPIASNRVTAARIPQLTSYNFFQIPSVPSYIICTGLEILLAYRLGCEFKVIGARILCPQDDSVLWNTVPHAYSLLDRTYPEFIRLRLQLPHTFYSIFLSTDRFFCADCVTERRKLNLPLAGHKAAGQHASR